MAITIDDQPYTITPANQKLIVVASSDQTGQDGFKYLVEVVLSNAGVTLYFYVSPNPANVLVFNIQDLIQLSNALEISSTIVHKITTALTETGSEIANIDVYEAWIVGGVLTVDPNAIGPATTSSIGLWNAAYQISDGYKPDPITRYALTGTTKYFPSDYRQDTHKWMLSETYGFGSSSIYIPSRSSDWGVISLVRGLSGDTATKVQFTMYDDAGAPTGLSRTIGSGALRHIGAFPANFVGTAIDITAIPNWRAITAQALDSGNVAMSRMYVIYNAEVYGNGGSDCNHDYVRLAWVGSGGSWEYFNFIKKNEESVNVERKRFQKIVGDYSGATFSFNTYDAGLTELTPIVEQFLDITSDWIQEGEFVYLKGLIVSKQVHWVQDDGTFIPVVVETNNYKMARERNGKLKNLELKLRLANNLVT